MKEDVSEATACLLYGAHATLSAVGAAAAALGWRACSQDVG